jgi:hypothetical protein
VLAVVKSVDDEVQKGDDKFLVATRVELVLFPMEPNCAKLSSVWRDHVIVTGNRPGECSGFLGNKIAYVSEGGDVIGWLRPRESDIRDGIAK